MTERLLRFWTGFSENPRGEESRMAPVADEFGGSRKCLCARRIQEDEGWIQYNAALRLMIVVFSFFYGIWSNAGEEASAPDLSELGGKLEGNRITARGISDQVKLDKILLVASEKFRPQELWVDGSSISGDAIIAISKMTSLRTLSLGYTRIDGKLLRALSKLENLENLENLYLTGTGICSSDIEFLSSCSHIEKLVFGGTKVDDDCLLVISKLRRLRALYFFGEKVSDKGALEISKCRLLEELSVERTQMGDAGIRNILDRCSKLRSVNVGGTGIGNESMRNANKLKELESINLSNTSVGGLGVSSLAELDNLKYLNISGNIIDEDCASQISRMKRLAVIQMRQSTLTTNAKRVIELLPSNVTLVNFDTIKVLDASQEPMSPEMPQPVTAKESEPTQPVTTKDRAEKDEGKPQQPEDPNRP